jgi:hypothetical protein
MSDDLVKRLNDARDFPSNTCGASRHAAMIAEALCKLEDYPMLVEEPEHCGESIAATVAALWECRADLRKMALDLIAADGQAAEAYQAQLAAEAKLATCEKYRDAYAESDRIGTQAVCDLEAKLDRLVRASTKVHDSHWYSTDGTIEGMFDLGEALRLAQLKGETDA